MCGIWGYVGSNSGDSISVEDAWKGLCTLTDRGPDDWGVFTDSTGKITEDSQVTSAQCTVALGNRRLSILDLSEAGNQPMDADGRYWMVHNGEVYNYRELRTELQEKGYRFNSDTDTEVVLRAYEEYGADCVERFRGMFAFAIWDSVRESLFAARDRFGIKPFYYDATGSDIAFASEILSLLDGGVTKADLDPVAVDGFLALGSVPGERTILNDVRSLPPGSVMQYDRTSGDLEVSRYWRLFDEVEQDNAETDLVDDVEDGNLPNRIQHLLRESVQLRMRSDVPVGAFLSGGLDSSAIVAAMRSVHDSSEPLHTFSIDFEREAHSEGAVASEVGEAFGTEHHARTVTAGDVREKLPDIISQMDQPTIDGVNTFFVSELAAEHDLHVVLSGLGSDEFFYGYPTFRRVSLLNRGAKFANALPNPVQSGLLQSIGLVEDVLPNSKTGALLDVLDSEGTFGPAYVAARGLFTRRQRKQLTEPSAVHDWGSEIQSSIAATLAERQLEDAVSQAEVEWYMHNQLLRDTDVMSMGHSLEVRVPFLDTELATLVASVDPAVKSQGEKGLLKDAVGDALPESVLNRAKTGFVFPFDEWLSGALQPVVEDALSSSRISATPIDRGFAEQIRERHEEGEMHWSRLWALVVLSLWVDEHIIGRDSQNI